MRNLKYVFTVAVLLIFIASTTIVLADVPTVLDIEATKEGDNTVLEIEIRHSDPTSTHYIDVIEVEVNERLDRVDGLDPQTTTIFTYNHDIGTVEYEAVRVRAHCNLHGWSSWTAMGAPPEPPFLETPLGLATVGGAIAAVVVVVLVVLKMSGKI